MSLTKLEENLNIIENLPDSPNLEPSELKRKFDQGTKTIKNYINEILTKEIDKNIEQINNELRSKLNIKDAEIYIKNIGSSDSNINEINKTEFRYTKDITRTPNRSSGYLLTHVYKNEYIIQEFTSYDANDKWIRAKTEETWGKWKHITGTETATLQLSNKWAIHSDLQPQIYREASSIHIAFAVKNGTSQEIACLQEGFRPARTMLVPATNWTTKKSTLVWIQSSGIILCESGDIGGLLVVNATLQI